MGFNDEGPGVGDVEDPARVPKPETPYSRSCASLTVVNDKDV